MVEDLIDMQKNPTIAPYAKTGEVHLRITARAKDKESAEKMISPVIEELTKRFGDYIYTTREDVALEQAVSELLLEKNLTLTTVESCTGGLLSARLINVPGISQVFREGYITYSNDAKSKILGIAPSLIYQYGAVSEEIAKEMAKNALQISKSDIAVAITGIAGPDGGTLEKPVGLVFIACNVCGHIYCNEYRFSGNRAKIRENTVSVALTFLRKSILDYFSENAI